jgi:ABC-type phosphate/phosphonate transport system substrate-binding protein
VVNDVIANARMYSLNAATTSAWRTLLAWAMARAGVPGDVFDYPAPQPLPALWARPDLGGVFMCGYPLSRTHPRPLVLAAPVPNAPGFNNAPVYWTDMIVRADAPFATLEDTFGHRIAYTTPESQSGYQAPRRLLAPFAQQRQRLFAATVGPLVTPRRVIEAILGGDADVGPLDSYAHALLRVSEPALMARLRVVASTPPTPIPPLVASAGVDAHVVARLRNALDQVGSSDTLAPVLETLALLRFAPVDATAYDVLQRQAAEADEAGYHELA